MDIIAYFSSLNPLNLLSSLPGNIAQGVIWGIMALGMFATFRLLDFADLTVDGSFAAGGAVTVMLILVGVPAPAALLIAVAAGVLAGLVTGLLHTIFGIPGILAGILTQISLWSVNLLVLGGANKAVNVDKYALIVSLRSVNSSLITVLAFTAVLICVLYWYFGTEQGSAIRATGANPHMAKAQGINIDTMKVLALCISNGLVALSGGLMSQYQGFADVSMGIGTIVAGLASVIVGEVLLGRSRIMVWLFAVLLGSILYRLIIALVLKLGFQPTDLKLFTAAIVTIALISPFFKDYLKKVKA